MGRARRHLKINQESKYDLSEINYFRGYNVLMQQILHNLCFASLRLYTYD